MVRVLFLLALTGFSLAKHLPSYIKPCRRNDPNFNECVKKHAKDAIPNIVKGDKEYGIPNLDPFLLSQIDIEAGRTFSIKLKDVVIRGMGQIQLLDIMIDLKTQHIYTKIFLKTVTIDAQYDIDGRVLVIPIKGTGPIHLLCENLLADYSFNFKLMKKKGKNYIDPNISAKVTYTVENVNVKLENLFNGDKVLGDRINEFLNDNALEINKEFSDTFAEAINSITTRVIKKILPLVPYDEVFI